MTCATVYTVDGLMGITFTPGRTKRSSAYIAGARAKFSHHLNKTPIRCPHSEGSAEFDAFYAGLDEARHIIRAEQVEAA
jgi:hypothetical protein